MRETITAIVITSAILIAGCATVSTLAHERISADLRTVFPDIAETNPELIDAVAWRIVGLGAEKLSEFCNAGCDRFGSENESLCAMACNPYIETNADKEYYEDLDRIGNVSPEADIFVPILVQD